MIIFIEQANKHHPTTNINSWLKYPQPKLVVVYKGKRFERESLLDVSTHFKAMEHMHTFPRATHPLSKEVSLKERH